MKILNSNELILNKETIAYCILLLPITNYNVLGLSPLLAIPFIKNLNWKTLYWITLITLLIILNLQNFEVSNLKYYAPLILYALLRKNIDYLKFIRISALILVIGIISEFFFTDEFRSLFRSSNEAFHYERYSSFFLFPGDLGSFGAILISIELMMLSSTTSSNRNHFYYIAIGLLLIIASQSRMALFQLMISFGLFSLIKPRWVMLIIPLAALFLAKFADNFAYLFKENLFDLLSSFNPFDAASKNNKRALEFMELFFLNNNNTDFFEGSIPSFFSRFGVLGLVLLAFIILFFCIKHYRMLKINLLIVVFPIFITSFIGAPLERPKLLIFSICALIFAFIQTKKSGQYHLSNY